MATDTRPALTRAKRALAADRVRAPATIANTSRNARAEIDRHARWAPARDALWHLLQPHLAHSARVAVVGAGNCDDLPLTRIAEHAREVTLIDLDVRAIQSARRRQSRRLRPRIDVIEHDVSHGAANAIVTAAANAAVPAAPLAPESPLPGAPYDLVIGDLLYSQTLYPALVDLGVPPGRIAAFLAHYAPGVTRSIVSRLQISAPNGIVVHIHDPIAWWPGHPQPVTLNQILTIAKLHANAGLRLAARGDGPHRSDPRTALHQFAIPIVDTALWRWPFAEQVEYLACATLTAAASI
ncbi:MAG: hypothetical protein M3071_09280 [Actinomycetota bacterium]|nr:hypothetical protein [Actinomycetota bacterium]